MITELKPVAQKVKVVRDYVRQQIDEAYLPWKEVLYDHFSKMKQKTGQYLSQSRLDIENS